MKHYLLLESGGRLLLETGGALRLETSDQPDESVSMAGAVRCPVRLT